MVDEKCFGSFFLEAINSLAKCGNQWYANRSPDLRKLYLNQLLATHGPQHRQKSGERSIRKDKEESGREKEGERAM